MFSAWARQTGVALVSSLLGRSDANQAENVERRRDAFDLAVLKGFRRGAVTGMDKFEIQRHSSRSSRNVTRKRTTIV